MNTRLRQIKRARKLGLTNVINFKVLDLSTGKFKIIRGKPVFSIENTKNKRYYYLEALKNIVGNNNSTSTITTEHYLKEAIKKIISEEKLSQD